jgi:tetratricopeptide (TPR) repeat protein
MIFSTNGEIGGRAPRVAGRIVLGTAIMASSAASAEPPKRDPAAAEALFRSGRDLIAAGNYVEGCPKFDASFALDPSIGSLLNIAKCHEHEGKIASAWADYQQALALNRDTHGAERQARLEKIARDRIAALEPRLPKLQITVAQPPIGLKVLRDSREMPVASLGEALPMDPGQHEVSASAPGYRTETRSVALEEGKTAALEIALVIALVKEVKAAPPARGGVPVWAWVTGGAGIALVSASIYFLTQDLAAIRELKSHCSPIADGNWFCKQDYDPAADNARKNRSLGLFIGLGSAGVIAIGAAVVGIAQARRAREPPAAASVSISPWAGSQGGGIVAQGGF